MTCGGAPNEGAHREKNFNEDAEGRYSTGRYRCQKLRAPLARKETVVERYWQAMVPALRCHRVYGRGDTLLSAGEV